MTTNQTIDGVPLSVIAKEASEWIKKNSFGGTDAIDLWERLDAAVSSHDKPLAQKYDDTLLPFVALMRNELHANAGKGDRPGWLSMSADTCMLEIIYHFGKLQASVKRGDGDGMAEYGADVANLCMMLLDICGVINLVQHAEQPAPVALLAEAREWLGDGKHSDGMAREHWTPEYAALIDRIDATLRK
jgi:hypothetical protein